MADDTEAIEDLFGDIALERDLITPQQLQECRAQRQATLKSGKSIRLGEVMMRQGLLNKEQALEILKEAHLRSGRAPRIGGYQLEKALGRGAMGVVYLARQVSMDRPVALKLLPRRLSQDPDLVQKFMREARVCARLNHPNIVTAIDVGESNGYHYFAMEYVQGRTLERLLKREKMLDEKRVLSIALQAVQGLEHAHIHDIIHRDIKPANIMVCDDGTVKIADLGLAVVQDKTSSGSHSEAGAIGTPYYMSPEQAEGRRDIDSRADIYALGATLLEALTGRKPWEGANVAAIMARRLYEDPPVARTLRQGVSRGISEVLYTMMAREPADRYQDFQDLLDDLQQVAEGKSPKHARKLPRETRHAPTAPATPKRRPFPRWLLPASAIVTAAAVVVALVLAYINSSPSHPIPSRQQQDLWRPYAAVPMPGDQARAAWVKARDMQAALDARKGDPKPAELKQLIGCYEELIQNHPNSAYALRAETIVAKLRKRLQP